MRYIISAAALMTAAFISTSAQAQTYRADANEEIYINLKACSPRIALSVMGDGDTDLDFVLKDPDGNTVDQETSDTDRMYLTFRTRLFQSDHTCRTYRLYVTNYGNVYNEFSVHVQPA